MAGWVYQQTGYHVQLAVKEHRCFTASVQDMIGQHAGESQQAPSVPDHLLLQGNCIPLGIRVLGGPRVVQDNAFQDPAISRSHDEVARRCGLTLVPKLRYAGPRHTGTPPHLQRERRESP